MHTIDGDAISRDTRGAPVQVILLDIHPVFGDAAQRDVLVGDAPNRARRARVGLDPGTVLRVDDLAVAKCHSVNRVVTLPTHGTDGQSMPTIAIRVVDDDVGSGGHGDAVVLVMDPDVLQPDEVAGRDVKAITVVGSSEASRPGIWGVTGGIVERQVTDG